MRDDEVGRRIAGRLSGLREAQGLSARALGLRSGVTTEMVTRAEGGERTPSVPTLAKMCEGLGITLGEFFDGFEGGKNLPLSSGDLRRLELTLGTLSPDLRGAIVEAVALIARAASRSGQSTDKPVGPKAQRRRK